MPPGCLPQPRLAVCETGHVSLSQPFRCPFFRAFRLGLPRLRRLLAIQGTPVKRVRLAEALRSSGLDELTVAQNYVVVVEKLRDGSRGYGRHAENAGGRAEGVQPHPGAAEVGWRGERGACRGEPVSQRSAAGAGFAERCDAA